MNATGKLDLYLAAFNQRLRKLMLLRGAAAVAVVLLVVGGIGAWFSVESGFAPTTISAFRVLLVLALVAVALRFVIDPLQKLKDNLSQPVETRVPELNGRIETYSQLKAANNPFLDLLAEDTLRISDQHPVEQSVPRRELAVAASALGGAVVLLLYLLIAGPGFLNYSLRNLLAGWAFHDLLPPQTITVTPGDQNVRRGTNMRITAAMSGFDPDDAVIHILDTGGKWQDVGMVKSPLGFEFTFFSMQNNARYYISATSLRSPEYSLNVVDVPGIEKLELTYNFPDWTAREPEVSTIGDVNALPDTRIALKVTTTAPLRDGQLVLNGTKQSLKQSGNDSSGEFTITADGQYFLAAMVGGEQVRLSDDYFIRLTADGKPEIRITRPNGDYNASSIEEVLARVEAKDDYGLRSLALQYSVNGAPFQKLDLFKKPAREITADHLFMLEDMRTPRKQLATANVGKFKVALDDKSADAAADKNKTAAVEPTPLQPGDLISFYAETSDRTQTVRTDMFFIQIQPYNRRYSQSQLSGGGGGGGGGQQQDEISKRQRQIIVSTWNLIREKANGDANGQVEINAKLLSDLQNTLAEQANTLADRARARGLDNDEQIREFVSNMDLAVQSMHPASEQLAKIGLNEAIQPAQEALQHLLRAESVFNDITVSQQRGGGGGGGGGGRSGQDLAEMYELEMDLSLNQYETGNNVSPQQQQQQSEDIMKKLDELAKRQAELANNLRNQRQLTDAQRYQQEMLKRQAEQLQQQLQQLQRGQQSNHQGQQQQAQNSPGQQGQQGQQGQAGQSGQSNQANNGNQQGNQQSGSQQSGQQVAQSQLQRRLDSALRAMNQAQQGMQGKLTPEEMQRAAEEATRQLQGARDQIAQDQQAGVQQTFDNMANRSQQMLRDQQRMEQQLQQAMQKAVKDREGGKDPNSRGMSQSEEAALAAAKRQLAAQLQTLQQQMSTATSSYGKDLPQANNELQRANSEMSESQLQQAVNDAATYIDAGYGLYIAGNESAVSAAMRNLAQRLQQAQKLAAANLGNDGNALDKARRQAQQLRTQMQQLAQAGNGQGNAQQNAQQGAQAAQGGNVGAGGGGYFGGGRVGGFWNNPADFYNGPIRLPQGWYDNIDNFTRQARDAVTSADLTPEQLKQIYDMLRQLESTRGNRNDAILAQEYGSMLTLLEQLETGLKAKDAGKDTSNVRTVQSDAVPEEYQDSVAEYFRRLSRQ